MHHISHDQHRGGGVGLPASITVHMTRGVCIQMEAGLHPGGCLPMGDGQTPPLELGKRAVCILLECFLVNSVTSQKVLALLHLLFLMLIFFIILVKTSSIILLHVAHSSYTLSKLLRTRMHSSRMCTARSSSCHGGSPHTPRAGTTLEQAPLLARSPSTSPLLRTRMHSSRMHTTCSSSCHGGLHTPQSRHHSGAGTLPLEQAPSPWSRYPLEQASPGAGTP